MKNNLLFLKTEKHHGANEFCIHLLNENKRSMMSINFIENSIRINYYISFPRKLFPLDKYSYFQYEYLQFMKIVYGLNPFKF